MPNRALDHLDSYRMDGNDVLMEIGSWMDLASEADGHRIAIWHTHPGGNIGPSKGDLRNKITDAAYLVVTLNKDRPAVPCWF